MADTAAACFEGVSVICKANVYFDGNVVSHTVVFNGNTKKTLGLIYPGSYTFTTGAPERMEIIAGSCSSRQAGQKAWTTYAAGTFFCVPAHSSFEIKVESGIAEYVCSYE